MMEKLEKPEIKFDQFIAAVGSGSTRSRNILNLMMTASFIAALALYNSLSPTYNWFSSRLAAIQGAYSWVRFTEDDPNRFFLIRDTTGAFKPNMFTLDEFKQEFRDKPQLSGGSIDSIKSIPSHLKICIPSYYFKADSTIDYAKIGHDTVYAVLNSISSMNTVTRQELDGLLRTYDRARIENSLLIKIPILGVSFDVNGLAIISAVAFGILFFLLYHSLSRERKNLTLVFKLAEKLGIDNLVLYQLLSMQQVLTIPASVDEYILSQQENKKIELSRRDKIQNFALKLFSLAPILAPMIIWGTIYANDDYTTLVGNSINEQMTNLTAQLARIFGGIAALVLGFCLYEWYYIDKLWKKEALDIRDQLIPHLLTEEERLRRS